MGSEPQQYPPTTPEVPPELANGNETAHSLRSQSRFEIETPEQDEHVGDPVTLAIIGAGQRGKVRRPALEF